MIDRVHIQQLTDDIKRINEAIELLDDSERHLLFQPDGVKHAAGRNSQPDWLPFAGDIPGLRQKVFRLLREEYDRAMSGKLDAMKAACSPPVTEKDV